MFLQWSGLDQFSEGFPGRYLLLCLARTRDHIEIFSLLTFFVQSAVTKGR